MKVPQYKSTPCNQLGIEHDYYYDHRSADALWVYSVRKANASHTLKGFGKGLLIRMVTE